jgi:hypothetical protein
MPPQARRLITAKSRCGRAITLLLLGSLFSLTNSIATARLNESLEQVTARYGARVLESKPANGLVSDSGIYRKSAFNILIEFMNGRVCSLTFTKTDTTPITEAEIDILLKANAENSAWKRRDFSKIDSEWWREDKGAYAQYKMVTRSLRITTTAYQTALDKFEKQQQQKFLEGF